MSSFSRAINLDIITVNKSNQLRKFIFSSKHRCFPNITLVELTVPHNHVYKPVRIFIKILKTVRIPRRL